MGTADSIVDTLTKGVKIMSQLTLQQIIEALSKMDRSDLEELALAYSMSHAKLCEIAGVTSHEHEHGHALEQQMREKISAKDTEKLANILAPAVMLGRVMQ
jgi:hypothetical protein